MSRICYRALAVVLAALTLLGAWLLYKGDFWTLRTEEQKVHAIWEYASADPGDTHSLRAVLHPVILHDETFGSRRILTFTDSEIPGLLGNIQFRRGILGGWQPLEASYRAGPAIQSDRIRDTDIRVVYAAHCPPEIAHYKVQANLENNATLMAEGDVTSPDFFHVYETDRDYFPDIYLYDKDGNELSWQDYLACDDSVPSPGIGSAETDLVYWFCGILLLVGWVIVKFTWDAGAPEQNKSKETAVRSSPIKKFS